MERKALTQPAAIPLGMGKGHAAGAKGGCLPGTGLCKKKNPEESQLWEDLGQNKGSRELASRDARSPERSGTLQRWEPTEAPRKAGARHSRARLTSAHDGRSPG